MNTWELAFVVIVFFACLVNIALLYLSERKHGERVNRYYEAVLRYAAAVNMERLHCAVNRRRGEEE